MMKQPPKPAVGAGPGLLSALLIALAAAGCTEAYVSDPWAGSAPQWKRAHFATHSPDAALDRRLMHTQVDR